MSAFELYDNLKVKSETLVEVPDVWAYCMNLPTENVEIVFALIWHHYTLENKNVKPLSGKKSVLPYGGKVFDSGKGATYKVSDIPLPLQKILAVYIQTVVS